MADESDVSNAILDAVVAALYPNGTGQPSITGIATKAYRGWPQASDLDKDLTAQRVNVTVCPRDGMSRNTTRWSPLDVELPATPPTVTASVSGATVTFGGTATAGNLVGIAVHTTGYAYAVQPGDTLASIAQHFATVFGVAAVGASVTVPTNYPVTALTMAPGTSARISRQTGQGFTVTIWAYDYPSRDATASAIDSALAAIQFLPLADGSVAHIRFAQTLSTDKAENANLYRRDLVYLADYPATLVITGPRVLFAGLNLSRVIGVTVGATPDAVSGHVYPALPNFSP